jgi:glycosyltransferase involved in cell wall biosynthesis
LEQKKIHILFLCSWYPNPENATHGIFYKRHAEALSIQHNVTVVYSKSLDSISEETISIKQTGNFKEICLFYPKITNKIIVINNIIKLLKYRSSYNKVFEKNYLPDEFDIIHVNTIFPVGIAALIAIKKWSKAKLFVSEQWSGYYAEDGNYKGFFRKYITKKIIQKTKAIFVISDKLKYSMMSHGLLGNYESINNTVDTSIFKPQDSTFNKNNELQLLHISSLVNREKNIIGIIDIIGELVTKKINVKLTIIGSNEKEKKVYDQLINEKKLNEFIDFVGYKTPKEITEYMKISDLFLLFSNFEGMPNVILESLACGLPVISTDVGKVREMINSNMGIVLKDNTIEECVNFISKYRRENFADKEIMHQYIVSHYSPIAISNQITEIYNKYLN